MFFGGWDFASGFTESGWVQAFLPAETHRKWPRLKCQRLQSFPGKVSGSLANMEINSYKSVSQLTENTLQTLTAEALYLKWQMKYLTLVFTPARKLGCIDSAFMVLYQVIVESL